MNKITLPGITDPIKLYINEYPPNVTIDATQHQYIDTLDIIIHRAFKLAVSKPHRLITVTDDYGLTYARLFFPHPIAGRNDDGSL